MSFDEIAVKRLRRQWEPEKKTWDDEALEVPWEELAVHLHKATIFALKNIFFFSHATAVQSRTIDVFCSSGSSVLVEAPTGSGKTLAVLVPLLERVMRACDAHIAETGRPLLGRDIVCVILSPSRVLAEQTFVVARNLAARHPHAIRVALCGGALQSPKKTLEALCRAARGAGTFLVTTPSDFAEFTAVLESSNGAVRLRGCHTERFVLVVDEADFVFQSENMRGIVTGFIDRYAETAEPQLKRQKQDLSASLSSNRLAMDLAFLGATVSTSQTLQEYKSHIAATIGSEMHTVVLNSTTDYVAKLQNRYVVCEAHEFLPLLIQLINLHSSKKHFIFFNSTKTLRFVEKLFFALRESECPLLYIKHFFVMYEGMSERARLDQYNAFLNHDTGKQQLEMNKNRNSQGQGQHHRHQNSNNNNNHFSAGAKQNQVYVGGWKRDGRQPDGKGAILLCTDMAAFGLDVRDVEYVYHFEPPTTVQSYVHRIGRVARMGMRGSSVLLLPCVSEENQLVFARERKTTSSRFNTIANTRHSTAELQSGRLTLDVLSEERRCYLHELCSRTALQPYSFPVFAPITSTIRNIICQQKSLLKLAKSAAMSMCTGRDDGNEGASWFDPKMALQTILLD